MSQPPDTSATANTAATTTARDRIRFSPRPRTVRRPRVAGRSSLEREKNGPALAQQLAHALKDFVLTAACVNDGDRSAFRMALLPLRGCELTKRRAHPSMEFVGRGFDTVVRSAARNARHAFNRREVEQDRDVGCQSARRHSIRGDELVLGNAASDALIRICRQKESIDEDDGVPLERR